MNLPFAYYQHSTKNYLSLPTFSKAPLASAKAFPQPEENTEITPASPNFPKLPTNQLFTKPRPFWHLNCQALSCESPSSISLAIAVTRCH